MRQQLYIDIADYPVRVHRDEDGELWFCMADVLKAIKITTTAGDVINSLDKTCGPGHTARFPSLSKNGWGSTGYIDTKAARMYLSRSRSALKASLEAVLADPPKPKPHIPRAT